MSDKLTTALQELSISPVKQDRLAIERLEKQYGASLLEIINQMENYAIVHQSIVATPSRHLSPTAIGELYAERNGLPQPIKPQIVNRVLESAGLQTKEVQVKTDTNGKQSHKNIWHLTEKGKLWGTVTRDKARSHNKIVEHVRWLPDVLEVIDLSVEQRFIENI